MTLFLERWQDQELADAHASIFRPVVERIDGGVSHKVVAGSVTVALAFEPYYLLT